jgi:hypothetical protein
MPVSLISTGVQFPDNSIQTTAASTPTTAQVLTATAGAAVGDVGTYAYLRPNNTTTYSAGNTLAGSSLRYQSSPSRNLGGAFISSTTDGGTPSGTWRCMGNRQGSDSDGNPSSEPATLWLRIS